ncbi:hypothetical protein C8R44DRAFT_882466 [Mycena epipterygia]|nr:hypothetical protein C8R44DRAFT_882466 [Mycena epipterygia]
MDDSSITPTLPLELERYIFEIAALARPKSIPDLMRVAWRVKHWLEPLLYRTLVVRHLAEPTDCFPSCDVATFMKIASTQKMSFLRDSVRNLVVDFLSTEDTHAVLSACPSVENLHVITAGTSNLPFTAPPLDAMPLRHLYCGLKEFCTITSFEPFHHSSFHRITHLELFYGLEGPWTWSRLVELPQLTHLTHSTATVIPACGQVLADLKSLRALIILDIPPADPSAELDLLSEDPRFVMIQLDSYEQDWQEGILTGVDYWVRADEFIAKRISGEIDRHTFFLEEAEEDSETSSSESESMTDSE